MSLQGAKRLGRTVPYTVSIIVQDHLRLSRLILEQVPDIEFCKSSSTPFISILGTAGVDKYWERENERTNIFELRVILERYLNRGRYIANVNGAYFEDTNIHFGREDEGYSIKLNELNNFFHYLLLDQIVSRYHSRDIYKPDRDYISLMKELDHEK